MRILVVDDEPDLCRQVGHALSEQRYDVDTAQNGEEALDRIFESEYDLVILDIMLPKVDGLEILREMRGAGIHTPVIMLTARDSVEDKVSGLDSGADDYMPKPFSMAELMARVRSLLRRVSEAGTPLLSADDIVLDTVKREVFRSGQPVELTAKEFLILEFLLYNKNRVVSRYSLAEHIWGDDFDPATMSNVIDVHIKNLRRKIGDAQKHAAIQTIRGIGYVIKEPER